MIIFLLAGILPAVLLVAIGESRYRKLEQPDGLTGWIGFLSLGTALLLGGLLLLTGFHQGSSLPVLVLLPTICAFFGELLLALFLIIGHLIRGRAFPGWRWPAGLLLLVIVMFVALSRWGDRTILLTIAVGGLLLACGWLVWHRQGWWFGVSYIAVLLLMVASVWATDTQNDFGFLPETLAPAGQLLFWLAPGLGIILSFRLLGWAMKSETGDGLRRSLLAAVLMIPLFLLLGWQAATASAWDVATDGLGGISMLMLASVFGVAAAIHESWDLPRKRRSFTFGFVVMFLIVITGANSFGTYGLMGKWGTVPHERTERRAARIDGAIRQYYEEQGRYPHELSELTPKYLLYLPKPFIIPHQDWCYQGGPDYYRLGYVDREFFSTPAFVTVFAAAGQMPSPAWNCETEAARYPAPQGYSNP